MTWTKSTREELLSKAKEVSMKLSAPGFGGLSIEELEKLDIEETNLLEEYAENIPFASVSRCPFCETKLEVAIDLIGLDGPWWWATCPVELPAHDSCEHFQLFQGAVNLAGKVPVEVYEGVMPGPGIPFVIQRLLDFDDVKAVVTQLPMEAGYIAYMIAYFSKAPIDQADLHQEWRKEWYALLDDDGVIQGTDSKFDPWDFDLAHYIESGKLLWVGQGDTSMQLQAGLPSPFVDMQGTQAKQVIEGGEVHLIAAPEGQESSKFDPD